MGKTEKFDNIDLIAAKFQQNPFEFKRQFMTRPEPSLTRTERNDAVEKLWDEYTELVKQEGKSDEIIRCMDSIIQLDPKDGYAWSSKGIALGILGKPEESIGCFDKAIELDPKYVFAWGGKGNELSDLGKPEEAIKCYDKALELDPKYVFAWYNKGAALRNLGKHEESIKCYDKAIELDPKDVFA